MEVKIDNICNEKNLKNISVILKQSQITALIGSNDSGVTDLLNIVSRQKEPMSGTVTIIDSKNSKDEVKISYLNLDFKKHFFNINIYEDIKLNTDKINEENLTELMSLFKLDKTLLYKNYSELSSGELKKFALISVLIQDKDIILLDNPTVFLDRRSIQTLIKILRKERAKNKIILINSEDSNFLLEVCDRVIVFYNNKILIDDTKYNILENKKILDKIDMDIPNVLDFRNKLLEIKDIKLDYRDNINDLIKDIYRNAR